MVSPVAIQQIACDPLSVPLRRPFVIASGRLDTTRAVLVSAILQDPATGRTACGWGEAAALPPVTREDQPELRVRLWRAVALWFALASCAEVTARSMAAVARQCYRSAAVETAVVTPGRGYGCDNARALGSRLNPRGWWPA